MNIYAIAVGNPVLLFVFMLLGFYGVSAQSNEELMGTYKDDYAIFTKYYQHITFYFEGDELKAQSDIEKETLLLEDHVASSFATQSVVHSFFSKLAYLEAATLIPARKGFDEIKTKNIKIKPNRIDNVFYDDSKESEVSFTNLKRGSRTSLKYGIHYRDPHLLPRIFLQNYLPHHHLKIEISYPKGVVIDAKIIGADATWLKISKRENRKTVTETWEAFNVPKFKIYDDAPGINTYVPQMTVLVREYIHPSTGVRVPVLGNTPDLNRYLFHYLKNVNPTVSDELKTRVSEITEGLHTDEEKVAAIFKWVQSNIRYIAFEDSLGGFIPRDASQVYRRKFGDCKDMSSILKVMCEQAGIESRYTWIGTRSLPYSIREIPMPGAFNHMICAVKIKEEWIFLDATDETIPFRFIPYTIQGKEALININENEYEVVPIPVVSDSAGMVNDTSLIAIHDNVIKGEAKIVYKGYPAWVLSGILKYKSEKEKENAFHSITSRGNNKYEQKSFAYHFDTDDQKALHIAAEFQLIDYIKRLGEDYYVNMHLLKPYADAKVEAGDRIAPLENDFKETLKYIVVLKIPEDYKATYIPPLLHIDIKDVASAHIQYDVKEDRIIMTNEIRIRHIQLNADQFPDYNRFISALQSAYKETIELTKNN